ncbi:MAG: glycosyltransferase [Bacteroidales bacterium]|nr:glycosyltransferase [Bacteroidales bacterium]
MKEPIRVLQIVSNLSVGSGILSLVYNWHRRVDTDKVQFDYLYCMESAVTRKREIEQLGGQCYQLSHPIHHPWRFVCESYRFFKTHHYHTIHSHVTHLNLFFYPLAKWFGTKNILQHAHASRWGFSFISNVRNYLMLHAVWPLLTHKIACSPETGDIYYGKDFTVINNGIEIEKFAYDPNVRSVMRKELGIENNFVIGHVGRFSTEKNHKFLIDVFGEIIKLQPTAKLILVGDGPLRSQIEQLAQEKNLQGKVCCLGSRKDVAQLYQTFDCFVLPSLHEGMPVVGIEAQTAGLPCVFSDTITRGVLLLPQSCMCSLKATSLQWAEKILSFQNMTRADGALWVREKGFDIRQTAKEMGKIYLRCSGQEKSV